MESRKVIVDNQCGLHVRPAARFAKHAEQCTSHVEIVYNGTVLNAKSILNIVSQAIAKGSEIELRCTGPDEKKDIEVVVEAMNHLDED
ncbi:MAG: HPr family phosphocarrier protein [Eubacteriales bacterium]|nr:HPr family phosphocarrier protein [Eubacteriales bacterium]